MKEHRDERLKSLNSLNKLPDLQTNDLVTIRRSKLEAPVLGNSRSLVPTATDIYIVLEVSPSAARLKSMITGNLISVARNKLEKITLEQLENIKTIPGMDETTFQRNLFSKKKNVHKLLFKLSQLTNPNEEGLENDNIDYQACREDLCERMLGVHIEDDLSETETGNHIPENRVENDNHENDEDAMEGHEENVIQDLENINNVDNDLEETDDENTVFEAAANENEEVIESPIRGEKEKSTTNQHQDDTIENWSIEDIRGNHLVPEAQPQILEIDVEERIIPEAVEIAEAFDDRLLDENVEDETDGETPESHIVQGKTVKLRFDNRRANIISIEKYRKRIKINSNQVFYLTKPSEPTPQGSSSQEKASSKRVCFDTICISHFNPWAPTKSLKF